MCGVLLRYKAGSCAESQALYRAQLWMNGGEVG
jgi:hypothetical protein